MGGSKAPEIKKAKPRTISQVTPLQSYEQAAAYLADLRKQTNDMLAQRYTETGTPAQLGAANLGYKTQENASYLSSLPVADKYVKELTGNVDHYGAVKEAASKKLSESQLAYAKALENKDAVPTPFDPERVPEWAKSTIPKGMPPATA